MGGVEAAYTSLNPYAFTLPPGITLCLLPSPVASCICRQWTACGRHGCCGAEYCILLQAAVLLSPPCHHVKQFNLFFGKGRTAFPCYHLPFFSPTTTCSSVPGLPSFLYYSYPPLGQTCLYHAPPPSLPALPQTPAFYHTVANLVTLSPALPVYSRPFPPPATACLACHSACLPSTYLPPITPTTTTPAVDWRLDGDKPAHARALL